MGINGKNTVRTFKKMKDEHRKIVMLTAYDAPTARAAAEAGVDLILVGDSLGMNTLGYKDTIPVTMDDMILHSRAVRRGAPDTFVVGDMPYLSYHTGISEAVKNAGRFMQEASCDCVKLESAACAIPVVKAMVEAGIPVMAHIGLLPQSSRALGGYRVAGRSESEADRLLNDALSLQEAGAFSIVLECLPAAVAKRITSSLAIPTIGIGAGPDCDGQVQVISDLLGYDESFLPKHAKRYAALSGIVKTAISEYCTEVRDGKFPADTNCF